MFRGNLERNLDPKGRLMLSPLYREEILKGSPEGRLVLTTFPDRCVAGYTMPEWERIEQALQSGNMLDVRFRNIQRLLFSGAEDVVLDKQGRILLPPSLRSFARLDKDVVVAGVGNKFELWDKETFVARRQSTQETFDIDTAALARDGFVLRL